jgi:type IV pilus assembly protein PilW
VRQPINQTNAARQQGMTIVEMMIALVIGAMLIAGITQVFVSSKVSFETQDNISRMQENARFAFYYLTREIRMAGYRGCTRDGKVNNNLNLTTAYENFIYNVGNPMEGYGPNENIPNVTLSPARIMDSDALVIRSSEPSTLQVDTIQNSSNAASIHLINEDADHGIETGDIITLSDCIETTVFQVTDMKQGKKVLIHSTAAAISPGNASKDLRHEFGEEATVQKAQTTIFYLANNPEGEPALYRSINGAAGEELVPGIERLQFSYGVDTDADFVIDEYEDPDDVTFWEEVLSVRLSMVVRSPRQNVRDDAQTYDFFGNELTSNDGRQRHVINTTVALRNRNG